MVILTSKPCKVAYSGVFPSKDWEGRDLPPARSAMAGKPIAGGPFCLVQVRHWGSNKDCVVSMVSFKAILGFNLHQGRLEVAVGKLANETLLETQKRHLLQMPSRCWTRPKHVPLQIQTSELCIFLFKLYGDARHGHQHGSNRNIWQRIIFGVQLEVFSLGGTIPFI